MASLSKKSEREAIDEVASRLKDKYKDASKDHVKQVYEDAYANFKSARLRDYIAVLVEHEAKSTLNAEKRKKK
ncbi:three-helix bundle dimerization domain-containing protein [Diaminobutyricibacter sp. McL0618]|uniref:three-helix bundle dimerization domain-containing protein n=1 Tax=Leifsonia sp. McL0618 TaxID=3415677 RepID=UPI003CFAD9AD